MCIIAVKEKGQPFIQSEIIMNMWSHNSDGAGYMYNDPADGLVHIRKGFMTQKAFLDDYNKIIRKLDPKHTAMVLHFRIATHGGINKQCTHPFPISDDPKELKAQKLKTKIAVAHNGIIYSVTPRKGYSDTMEYISEVLTPLSRAMPEWRFDKNALKLVENTLESKLAVLDNKGNVVRIGDFTQDEITKHWFSNDGFKSRYNIYDTYRTFTFDDENPNYDQYDQINLSLQKLNDDDLVFLDEFNDSNECVVKEIKEDYNIDLAIDEWGCVYVKGLYDDSHWFTAEGVAYTLDGFNHSRMITEFNPQIGTFNANVVL